MGGGATDRPTLWEWLEFTDEGDLRLGRSGTASVARPRCALFKGDQHRQANDRGSGGMNPATS
jgi:hypothetical protein